MVDRREENASLVFLWNPQGQEGKRDEHENDEKEDHPHEGIARFVGMCPVKSVKDESQATHPTTPPTVDRRPLSWDNPPPHSTLANNPSRLDPPDN